MKKKSQEALEQIVKVTGCTLAEAKMLCCEVQNCCVIPPSFSSIATALLGHGHKDVPIMTLAQDAIAIHDHGSAIVLQPQKLQDHIREVVPSVFEVDLGHAVESLRSTLEPLAKAITRRVVNRLVLEPIEGLVIGFNGNGPYHETDLEKLAMRLGAIPDRDGIEWEDLDWIVVGRNEFDPKYLSHSVEVGGIRYLSQEAFLGLVFMGESLEPEGFDESHSGFAYLSTLAVDSDIAVQHPVDILNLVETPSEPDTAVVLPPLAPVLARHQIDTGPSTPSTSPATEAKDAVHPTNRPSDSLPPGWSSWGRPPRASAPDPTPEDFRWPTLSDTPSHEAKSGDSLNLNVESDLKKLGYSVARNVSVDERRKILNYAVQNLGLKKVVDHLTFLIRYFRKNRSKQDAIRSWRNDLAWLESRDWLRSRR